MAEIKFGDRAYEVAKKPVYDPVIRALKTSDPANADTVFNPLFGQIINNIHAVYQSAGNQNLLINGDFSIWQRGTEFNISKGRETYTADRWAILDFWKDNNTRVTQSDDVPPGEKGKSIAVQIEERATADWLFYQHLEERLVSGEQYTISSWIKGPAGAVVRQNINDIASPTHVLTGEWQYIQTTLTNSGTFSRVAALRQPSMPGTYLIKNMKLEKGPVATPFVKRSAFEEKRLCQRYYLPIHQGMKLWVTSGYKDSIWVAVPLQIPMRIALVLTPPPNGFFVSDMCASNGVYDMVPGNTTKTVAVSSTIVEFFLYKVNHGYKVPYVLTTQGGGSLDAEIYI